MTVLLIAEHDNKALKDATNKALTAAKALGGDVHVLVAGQGCRAVADAAAKLDGVKKVLIADNADLDYPAKLAAYQQFADQHFETDRYREFCATALPHVDEMVLEWVDSDDFRKLLTSTIQQTYPPHEWEKFEGHFGGLTRMWVKDEQSRLGAGASVADEAVVGGPAPAVTD